MDPRWDRIRISLLQQVESAEMEQDFAELLTAFQTLSGCARMRDAITCVQQSNQKAEETSRFFVRLWHERLMLQQTIGSFLMLCLWRRLITFYNQRSFWAETEEELASEIMRAFLVAVSDQATERAPLVSETLVFRTEQRVIEAKRRQLRLDGERRRRSQLPEWLNRRAPPSTEIGRFELADTIEALGRDADVETDF